MREDGAGKDVAEASTEAEKAHEAKSKQSDELEMVPPPPSYTEGNRTSNVKDQADARTHRNPFSFLRGSGASTNPSS